MTPIQRPLLGGRRRWALAAIVLAGAWAWARLDLGLAGLYPREGGLRIARDFLSAALSPALDYEALPPGAGTESFAGRLAVALLHTVLYAAAALALAVPPGLVLALLSSSSWWSQDPLVSGVSQRLGDGARGGLRSLVRLFIAALRSIHELLWAVLFLAAMGVSSATAVLALAIPLTGTLAKVYSEILDEADGRGERGVRAVGASGVASFLVGRLPAALPDMAAYTFYRFECATRTAAILGFFGFPTIGYALRASFEESHYHEVWSYTYAILALVLLLESWSACLRKRYVA